MSAAVCNVRIVFVIAVVLLVVLFSHYVVRFVQGLYTTSAYLLVTQLSAPSRRRSHRLFGGLVLL